MKTAIIPSVIVLTVLMTDAWGQAGGTFVVTSSLIASGGQRSTGAAFAVDGTIGQPIAGEVSSGGQFSLQSGFWTSTENLFAVSGRVMTADGRGVTNAVVTLDDNGSVRTVTTGRSGFYQFEGVEGGRMYLLRVASRRFSFANNPRMILVNNSVANEDFIGSQ